MNRRRVATIRRDSVLFLAGLGGIAYQQVTGRVHVELLIVFGLMIGLPGIASLLSLLGGNGADAATTSSSSPSPPSSSPSSSSPT